MPDIHGNYTPKEVAQQLGVSTAWINKVQSKTGIPRPVSTKGSEVKFDSLDLAELKNVYILRILNYSFGEIKEIYRLEKELVEFLYKNNLVRIPPEKNIGATAAKCVLFVGKKVASLEWASNIALPDFNQGEGFFTADEENEELEEYLRKLKKLVNIHSELLHRAKSLSDELLKILTVVVGAEINKTLPPELKRKISEK